MDMKAMKLLLGAACVALAGGLMTACTQDETEGLATGKLVPMTFTAGTAQTRTELGEGNAVNWVAGDAIAVWDGTEKLEFTTQDAGATAAFTGEARPAGSYTAFYPYANVTDISNEAITFNLPAEQTATAGTFANGLAPSWAQTADGSNQLQFHNLCALVKFTVGDGMAGEGTFTLKGANSESLAGRLTYTIGGGEASVGSNASAEVKLSGIFEAGETYYFVVAPATLEDGLSLFYKGSEGPAYRRAGASSVTFGAGKVTDLGTLTLSENFEEAIINTAFIDAVESKVTLTKNSDGTVTLTEANRNAMENFWDPLIITNNQNLKDMSGIEYFTNVSTLYCFSNKNLTSLDVSGMSNLTKLYCISNALTSLNVSGLSKLTTLECYDNATLTSLDASGLSSLETLRCNNCALTSLNVSGLSKLTRLDCFYNKLASLDVSDLSSLTNLDCSYNKISSADLRANTKLTKVNLAMNTLTSLRLEGCTAVNWLDCSSNNLAALDISSLSNLTYLDCDENKLVSLNTSKNTLLESLGCSSNSLKSLNVNNNPVLQTLSCGDNQITSLNLRYNTALTTLDCSSSPITALDLSYCPKLTSLDCNGCSLKSLTLLSNSELLTVDCSANSLNTLDVSACGLMHTLDCSSNLLTKLDVTKCSALTDLDCSDNLLTSLNVSANPSLTVLDCSGNSGLEKIWMNGTEQEEKVSLTKDSGTVYYNDGGLVIPDPVLKNYLATNFDLDGDGEISILESDAIRQLSIPDKGITDLSGLEACSNLETLNCSRNSIAVINLPDMPVLKTLTCFGNPLTKLNLAGCTALTTLRLMNTETNAINGTALSILGYDQAESLTLSLAQTPITSMTVSGSTVLTSLDLTANT